MHSELVVKNGQAIKNVSKNHTSNFSYRDFNEEATTEKYCELQYSLVNAYHSPHKISEGLAVLAITGVGKTKTTLGTLIGMLGKKSVLFVTSTNAIIDNCRSFRWGTDFKSPFLDDMRKNRFIGSVPDLNSEDKINTYLSNLKDFEFYCKNTPESNFVANYSDATFLTYHKLYYDIVHNYKGIEQKLVDLLSQKKVFIFDEASMTKSKEIGQTIVNFILAHEELRRIPRIGLSFSNIKAVNKMSYTDKDGKLCSTDVAEVWAGAGTLFKHIIFKLDAETALKDGILPVYKYLPVLVTSNDSLKKLKKTTNLSSRELSQSIKKFIQNIDKDSFVNTLKSVFSTEFSNMLTRRKENAKYTIQIPYQSKEALNNSKDYVDGCIRDALKEVFTSDISMESFTVISRDNTSSNLAIHDVDDVDSSTTSLVVVHTVNMLAEGVHLNKRRVNCLILLRDYSSFYTPRQVLGRVLHTYYDSQPIVVDICGSAEKDIGDSQYQDLAKLTDFGETEEEGVGVASNNSNNVNNLYLAIKDTVDLLKLNGLTSSSVKAELFDALCDRIQCENDECLTTYINIERWCREVLTKLGFIVKNSYTPVVYASSFYDKLVSSGVLEV